MEDSAQFIVGNEKDGITFRDIVLNHVRKILEITSEELRKKKKETVKSNFTHTIVEEDTRRSYIQAVEGLAIILLPYFDEQIKKVYEESFFVFNAYTYQLKKHFSEEIEQVLKEINKTEIPQEYFLDKKIYCAKILFAELNLLLKRQDYLKGQVYGEGYEE